jgi:hypothetical protein
LAAVVFAAGCASGTQTLPSAAMPFQSRDSHLTAGASSGLAITPAASAYVRGDVTGLRVWGSGAGVVTIRALDANGKPIVGKKAPAIAVSSNTIARLTVAPAKSGASGQFVLTAVTGTDSGSTCPTCLVVRPGSVALLVVVTPQSGKKASYKIPVAVAHKVVAVAFNPFPNPSLGGADAVLQYFDDNVKPSVIWDDIVAHNATSFPNVTGLAFGADGSFYISNSGLLGGAQGTVTKYAPGSATATPVQTFASPNLMSASGVALDARDNVYVSDNGFETVTRFPKKGGSVTIRTAWEGGAGVNGVAVDAANGQLVVAMNGSGLYYSPKSVNVGRLVTYPLNFGPNSAPSSRIDSSASNGVNEPYGVAIGPTGHLYAVNDYVSVVNGPPGPGPEYSTLTRYDAGLVSSNAKPDATASARLMWPLAVATDLTGTVYVANSTPPKNNGTPGKMFLVTYSGSFKTGARGQATIDLSAGIPAAYGPFYMNIEGVAVDPSPLRT